MADEDTEIDRRSGPDAERLLALESEVRQLRLQIADEVRTRQVVVVDERGVGRIRLSADGRVSHLQMLDHDGFDRIVLAARRGDGTVTVSARTTEGPTRVDVFALDAGGDDPVASTGLELVDAGNSVGGLSVRSGHPARAWTDPLL